MPLSHSSVRLFTRIVFIVSYQTYILSCVVYMMCRVWLVAISYVHHASVFLT